MDQETQTAVDVQNLLALFPVWDDVVWIPLQKRNFFEAQRGLEDLFRSLEPNEWLLIYWSGLFRGVPAVRGELTQTDWDSQVKPLIVRAVLNTATGKILSNFYQNLEFAEKLELASLILKNLPGKSRQEKTTWLKANKVSIFTYLTAIPAQALGVNPAVNLDMKQAKRAAAKYDSLPEDLKNSIFSFNVAENVFRIGQDNHLSEEKISLLAGACGQLLMGFVHIEDFQRHIQSTLLIDQRLSNDLFEEIKKKVVVGLEQSIGGVYEPITDVLEKEKNAGVLRLDELTVNKNDVRSEEAQSSPEQKTEEKIPVQVVEMPKEGQPLIIHRQETLIPEKKPFSGFSFPGFFKKKNEAETEPAAKAKLETPGEIVKDLLKKTPLREERKTVHYSEYRTPLTPFDNHGGEFIHLKKFDLGVEPKPSTETKLPAPETKVLEVPVTEIGRVQGKEAIVPEQKNKNFLWFSKNKKEGYQPSTPETVTKITELIKTPSDSKSQPTLEGNVVDLRDK